MNQNGSYDNWNDEIVRHIKNKKDWKHIGHIRIWNHGKRKVSVRVDSTPEWWKKELSSFWQLRNGQRVCGRNRRRLECRTVNMVWLYQM